MIIVKGFACLDDGFHSKWIEETGRLDHDQWLLKHVEPFIKQGGTCVEAGAHIGTWTLWLSNKVGHNGKVYAYEANKRAFNCIKYNCGGLKNVSLHNVALGTEAGSAGVVEIPDNYGMTYTTKNGNDVTVIALDDVNLANCHFIKIDCEGAEPEILEGAKKTIEKHRPVMLIEINVPALERNGYTVENIFEKLRTLRYSFRNIYENEPMEGVQYDILCQPNQ